MRTPVYKILSVLCDRTIKKKVDRPVRRNTDRNEPEERSVVQSDVVAPDNISNGGEYATEGQQT